MGREQIVLATSGGALRNAGNPDRRDRPASLSPDLAVAPQPSHGAMPQSGRLRRHQQRLCPRIAGFGTAKRRFAGGLLTACWPEVMNVERGAGPCPRRRRPACRSNVGKGSPSDHRARWRHSSPRPRRPAPKLLFEGLPSWRYQRGSTCLVTSNLPFDEWTEIFGSERLTGALLDRHTHHVHILEMNGESYRLNQSQKRRKSPKIPA